MQIGQSYFSGNSIKETSTKTEHATAVKGTTTSGASELANLKEGAVFKGEVLNIAGDKVTIALEQSGKLQARLQADVMLGVGDQLLFSVKENTSSQILIKPLFDSLYSAQTQVLEKALDMAGLSPTEKNFTVAKELMEAGLPVDKSNMVKVLSESIRFEGTSMDTLVSLHKMNIPVNEANIAQFERYQNYQHQLTGDIAGTAESIANFSEAFPEGVSKETLLNVTGQIIELFSEGTELQQSSEMNPLLANDNVAKDVSQAENNLKENVATDTPLNQEAETVDGKVVAQQIATEGEGNTNAANEAGETANTAKTAENTGALADKFGITKEELSQLETQLTKAGIPEKEVANLLQNTNSSNDLLNQMTQAMNQFVNSGQDINSILNLPSFKKMLSDMVKNNWSMSPDSMKDAKEIDELYDKIMKQSKSFENILSKNGGDTKNFSENSQNMRQNMQFMEQLNHNMIYAQMPLKLSNQNANSELYVYADKRKLMNKKDGISVMLHLDMDHLGTTDIKVTLTGTNVNARFYLNDQTSVDIVVNNMDELAEKLKERGFSLTNEVVKRQPQESINQVVDEVIDENAEKSIKRYTFDMRT